MLDLLNFQNESDSTYKLYHGDAMQMLDYIENETVQLIVTSPPYNIGKEYERNNRLSLEEYIEWLEPIIHKLCCKLLEGGSICWQVGNYIQDGEVFPLDYFFYKLFVDNGLQLRNRIIWRYNFGLHATRRLSGRYETLLWFTKSRDYKFNLDPIRVPQMYPGKRHASDKGDKAGTPSGNRLGKNPSDIWEFSPETAFLEDPVWEIPNVKASHPEKTVHPCQFPTELVERCVLAFSDKNDLILDPFVGAGTSVIAAMKHERFGIGIDQSQAYVELAEKRLKSFVDGDLKLRPSGKPIRKPEKNEKVAKYPDEWLK